jgi:hypothetical protein
MKSCILGVVSFVVSKHFRWHGMPENNEMKPCIRSSLSRMNWICTRHYDRPSFNAQLCQFYIFDFVDRPYKENITFFHKWLKICWACKSLQLGFGLLLVLVGCCHVLMADIHGATESCIISLTSITASTDYIQITFFMLTVHVVEFMTCICIPGISA